MRNRCGALVHHTGCVSAPRQLHLGQAGGCTGGHGQENTSGCRAAGWAGTDGVPVAHPPLLPPPQLKVTVGLVLTIGLLPAMMTHPAGGLMYADATVCHWPGLHAAT